MRSKWVLVPIVLGLLFAIEIAILATHWPFTRPKVIRSLSQQAEGPVTIQEFHETFFPRPGCEARGVVIRHGEDPSEPPIVTVETLKVKASYASLLTFSRNLDEIDTEGMHIRVPKRRKEASEADRANAGGAEKESSDSSAAPSIAMHRFIADRATLEFAASDPSGQPFVIEVHHMQLSPASAAKSMAWQATLHIPEPSGEVAAGGRFGPWKRSDPYQTPVSGTYQLSHAKLGVFNGVAGDLSSEGRFDGAIDHLEVSGKASAADFEISAARHAVPIHASFQAVVDGRSGDVALDSIEASFLHTTVFSHGRVASPSEGATKEFTADLAVNRGRIQDLLYLVNGGPPDLTGVVSLRFHVTLPPRNEAFLKELRLTGEFGIGDARFRNPPTQEGLERISANAYHGDDDPASVVSDLRGRVSAANGVAMLRDIAFHVPGASALMNGTYQLMTHRIDLEGKVHLEENLSRTTTGIKSFLLKALDPFFHKRKHLSVVPVRIHGVAGHTSISLNL